MKAVLQESSPLATIVFVRENGYIYGYALEKFARSEKSGQVTDAESAQSRYFAGIDLGSKGSKASLFSVTPTAEGDEVALLFVKPGIPKLVSSMQNKKFTDDGMQDAVDAVKELVEAMKAKAKEQNVADVKYFIVGSSGVAAAENKETLAKRVREATTIEMDFIDAKREGYFGLVSSVPKSQVSGSMYMDVGSGNTKLGCVVGPLDFKNYKSGQIAFGSVTGSSEARKRNPDDVAAGVRDVMKDVRIGYMRDSADAPCLRNRQRIYWTGGAAWATATFTHPERSMMAYVYITRKDVDELLAKLTDGTWNQDTPAITYLKATTSAQRSQISAKAEKDRKEVVDVFVREQLLSGVSIMKNVLQESNPSATIVFVRENAIFTDTLWKNSVA